jgi:hypothetical protein
MLSSTSETKITNLQTAATHGARLLIQTCFRRGTRELHCIMYYVLYFYHLSLHSTRTQTNNPIAARRNLSIRNWISRSTLASK